jgi:hypothetical protein
MASFKVERRSVLGTVGKCIASSIIDEVCSSASAALEPRAEIQSSSMVTGQLVPEAPCDPASPPKVGEALLD